MKLFGQLVSPVPHYRTLLEHLISLKFSQVGLHLLACLLAYLLTHSQGYVDSRKYSASADTLISRHYYTRHTCTHQMWFGCILVCSLFLSPLTHSLTHSLTYSLTHLHAGKVDIGLTYDELIASNGRLRDLVTTLDVSQKDSSLRGTHSLTHSLTH